MYGETTAGDDGGNLLFGSLDFGTISKILIDSKILVRTKTPDKSQSQSVPAIFRILSRSDTRYKSDTTSYNLPLARPPAAQAEGGGRLPAKYLVTSVVSVRRPHRAPPPHTKQKSYLLTHNMV